MNARQPEDFRLAAQQLHNVARDVGLQSLQTLAGAAITGRLKKAKQLAQEVAAEAKLAPRKITKGKWGAEIDYNAGRQTAMDHIQEGHFFNARPGRLSSRFSQANSNPGQIKTLVNEAIAKGNHTTTSRGDYSVTYEFTEVIGTDINGRKTKALQVFLDQEGNVKNAYPITAP